MEGMRRTVIITAYFLVFFVTINVQAGKLLKFNQGELDPLQQVQSIQQSHSIQQMHNIQQSHGIQKMQNPNRSISDFIVQFHRSPQRSDQIFLEQNGIRIFRYLPDDAYIVRGSLQQLNDLKSKNPQIRAIMPFQGTFKMDLNFPNLSVFNASSSVQLLITLLSEEDLNPFFEQLQIIDPKLKLWSKFGRWLIVNTTFKSMPSLLQLQGLEYIQQNYPVETLDYKLESDTQEPSNIGSYDTLTGYETGTLLMSAPAAWSLDLRGQGQIVTVGDTGLDIGDPSTLSEDFKGVVHKGIIYGIGSKNWGDPMGHGTHVSGSVLGRGIYSAGKIIGLAHQSNLLVQAMWSTLIDNLTVPSKLSKMYEESYNEGSRIHTNSWGSAANLGSYESMSQQVDEYMWNHPDFLILFAAGNSGIDSNKDGLIDPGSIGTPATAKNCITVGASENLVFEGGIQKSASELKSGRDKWGAEPIASGKLSDNPNGIAMFSSRGPTKDGRRKPDVVAPGTNILSARSHLKTTSSSDLWGCL